MANVPAEVDRNMQVETSIPDTDLRFYDVRRAPFRIYGLYDPQNEPVFKRLPDEVGQNVNRGVKSLYLQTAGGRVRFSTDSAYIAIKAVMPYVKRLYHMPLTGTSGFDLYIDSEADSYYRGVFRFAENVKDGYESIIRFPDRKMRSFTINFPPYNALDSLYIGLQNDAALGDGKPYRSTLPIYTYGSSITQGACASRPGLSYQNIISRRMNLDYVNLGFSGNGLGEESIARYMAEQPMLMFVCDYDHNAPNADHLRQTHYRLYEIIREKQPDIPYIMLSRPDFDCNYGESVDRREVIAETYRRAVSAGDRNVYYIDGQGIFRGRDEDCCSVDGTHPNDIGFLKMAEHVGRAIERALR